MERVRKQVHLLTSADLAAFAVFMVIEDLKTRRIRVVK
jgi:hypothetical protein